MRKATKQEVDELRYKVREFERTIAELSVNYAHLFSFVLGELLKAKMDNVSLLKHICDLAKRISDDKDHFIDFATAQVKDRKTIIDILMTLKSHKEAIENIHQVLEDACIARPVEPEEPTIQ